jgi:mono/diheme cytochrome c family protein
MNEDTYSIQLVLEEQGRLVAVMKSDIRELTPVKTSPMPSYRERLTEAELTDVLAYLRSLKPID